MTMTNNLVGGAGNAFNTDGMVNKFAAAKFSVDGPSGPVKGDNQ